MNIIEARELAMQGKTVISPFGHEWKKENFSKDTCGTGFADELVFGEWREKKEPRKVYMIESEGKLSRFSISSTFEEAKRELTNPNERIIEFLEVINE